MFAVDKFGEVVESTPFVLKKHLYERSPDAIEGLWFLFGVIRFAGHFVPEVKSNAVAHTEHVRLSGIEHPVIVVAKSEQTMVFCEFHLIVALVLAFNIGGASTPLDIGCKGIGPGRIGV